MCFVLIHKSPERKTVTHRRMRVWKRFKEVFDYHTGSGKPVLMAYSSPYQYTRYGLTEEVKIDIRKLRPSKYENISARPLPTTKVARIHYGLHSYSTKAQAKRKRGYREVIVECWLPIGAVYYINPNNYEIVSSHLNIGPMPKPKK